VGDDNEHTKLDTPVIALFIASTAEGSKKAGGSSGNNEEMDIW
jgi:hypothetical protein